MPGVNKGMDDMNMGELVLLFLYCLREQRGLPEPAWRSDTGDGVKAAYHGIGACLFFFHYGERGVTADRHVRSLWKLRSKWEKRVASGKAPADLLEEIDTALDEATLKRDECVVRMDLAHEQIYVGRGEPPQLGFRIESVLAWKRIGVGESVPPRKPEQAGRSGTGRKEKLADELVDVLRRFLLRPPTRSEAHIFSLLLFGGDGLPTEAEARLDLLLAWSSQRGNWEKTVAGLRKTEREPDGNQAELAAWLERRKGKKLAKPRARLDVSKAVPRALREVRPAEIAAWLRRQGINQEDLHNQEERLAAIQKAYGIVYRQGRRKRETVKGMTRDQAEAVFQTLWPTKKNTIYFSQWDFLTG